MIIQGVFTRESEDFFNNCNELIRARGKIPCPYQLLKYDLCLLQLYLKVTICMTQDPEELNGAVAL